ncbi:MAG: carboxylesterase family protein [Saprospiraceae bacterium]|nr:carboxylesterase family protein [Saprospiraceae bacterium]
MIRDAFFLLCLLLPFCKALGQCDFSSIKYNIEVEEGVYYGSAESFDGEIDSLFLDIYRPVGDDNSARPLIIWCFGGGFIGGQRQDFSNVCEEFARRGYVSVTIDYRLGYVSPNFFSTPFAYDNRELLRAAYRAMQDAKGAVRFMKNRHQKDKTDPEEVYIGGASAGAITALATAFISEEEDIDTTFIRALPATNTNPAVERPDLGPVRGLLHLGQNDASVKGVVNIFGAVFDLDQVSAEDDIAIYSYHQTEDPIVPCYKDKAYWGLPLIAINMPTGHGSCALEEHLDAISYEPDLFESWIYDGDQHAIHDPVAMFDEIIYFLEGQICDDLTSTSSAERRDLVAYPNPVEDILYLNKKVGRVRILDIYGRTIKHLNGPESHLDVVDLRPGIYFLLNERTGEKIIFTKL